MLAAVLGVVPAAALADLGAGTGADPATANVAAYARARAADGAGDATRAAAGYAAALAAAPGNAVIAMRAYRGALTAGDDALADRAAAVLRTSAAPPPDLAVIAFARAARAHDAAGEAAALPAIGLGPFDFLAAPLAAWAAFDAGRDPLAPLDAARGNPLATRYIAESRALLLIATGRSAEGVAAVLALLGNDAGSLDLRFAAAQLLAAKGQRDLAATLLAGDAPILAAMRDKLTGATPGAAFGVSRLFSRLAGDLSTVGDPTPISIALPRAALRADPANDRARLLLADALSRQGDAAPALAALDSLPAGTPYRSVAEDIRARILARTGDATAALAAAGATAARPGADADAAVRLGDALMSVDRYDDAAAAYSRAIARSGDAPPWTLYVQLGGALDQAGKWPAARAALETALRLAPNSPVVLNYLGYASLDHGEASAASNRMIERASALAPDDPSITDSLGWSYFRQGDAARALPLLERAARGEPGNTTIDEHLGDAYWAAGRRYEARYSWRAAALTADAADDARLAARIEHGPPK